MTSRLQYLPADAQDSQKSSLVLAPLTSSKRIDQRLKKMKNENEGAIFKHIFFISLEV
jgi:hypothetical protein